MGVMSSLPSLGPRGEGWVVLQFVLLGLIAAAGWLARANVDGLLSIVALVAGMALIAIGGFMAVRGVVDLRDALTPLPHPRPDAELVETGIYAHARHPIYGGLILASVGWGLVTASPIALVLAAALAGFFVLKSMREEAWLIGHYPEYAAYRTRTKRFIPWIG